MKGIKTAAVCLVVSGLAALTIMTGMAQQSGQEMEKVRQEVRIEFEKSVLDRVWAAIERHKPVRTLETLNYPMYIYDTEIAEPFVPEGSRIGEVIEGPQIVTIDYFAGGSRVLVEYFRDGRVRKSVYDHESRKLMVNMNNEKYEVIDFGRSQAK